MTAYCAVLANTRHILNVAGVGFAYEFTNALG